MAHKSLACSLPILAAGHASMNLPLSRNNAGRVPVAPGATNSNLGGSIYWYQQGCFTGCDECVPSQGTGCCGSDDIAAACAPKAPSLPDKHRTLNKAAASGGATDWTQHHPWRAPGSAPTIHPCGALQMTAPATTATLPADTEAQKTHWKAGYVADVAWSVNTNHGGGYQYRLCPKKWDEKNNWTDPDTFDDPKALGKCFEDHVLPWGSPDSTMVFVDKSTPDVRLAAEDVVDGTFPVGSAWRKNQIVISGELDVLVPGAVGAPQNIQQMDKVQVPPRGWDGEWILQWRWDCEQTSQIWAHCADIVVDPPEFNMYSIQLAWDPWKCLNLNGGNTTNGNVVNIWDCNGMEDQRWIFTDGRIRFQKDPSKCVDLPDQNNGQRLQIWDCNEGDSQSFDFYADGYAIYPNKFSRENICLDLVGGDNTNGNEVQIWDCNGLQQQMWTVPDVRAFVSTTDRGKRCFDLPSGNAQNGQKLWMWECNDHDNQAWMWTNFLFRYGPDLHMCLDLPGSDTTDGRELWLWECSDDDNQKFGYNADTQAIYYKDDVTKCLDAGDGSLGAPLMLWTCNNMPQQKWDMPSLLDGSATLMV